MATARLTPETGGLRLDAFLAKSLPGYTRAFLKGLVESGGVRVDGERRAPDFRLRGGERVEADLPDAKAAAPSDDEFESWVLFEDRRLLVLNKPAGLLMHPLGTSWLTRPEAARADAQTNLAALLQVHRPAILRAGTPRCGIVHRLDRQTSGCLAVAKDPETWSALTGAFSAREVHKIYRAIVRGVPKGASRVKAPIGRASGHRKIVVTPFGKSAETAFKVLSRKASAAIVEAEPLTGRTHQIRAHLAFLGHPVAGDPEFDRAAGAPPAPRTMLHARRLSFAHPATGRPAAFAADPPADFAAYWRSL
ncbi:MAG: RluA family pseudouridine synthase [Elusimicrobia bacterium]|nr:RluA family pseudouridine synthase [Elusimicrobiota bacterium]